LCFFPKFSVRKINKIDAQMTQLAQQAAKLKAERAALEQAAAKSSKTFSSSAGSCFTPETHVLLTDGSKSIATLSAGETVTWKWMTPRFLGRRRRRKL
jgi:hypothetical protein